MWNTDTRQQLGKRKETSTQYIVQWETKEAFYILNGSYHISGNSLGVLRISLLLVLLHITKFFFSCDNCAIIKIDNQREKNCEQHKATHKMTWNSQTIHFHAFNIYSVFTNSLFWSYCLFITCESWFQWILTNALKKQNP